MKIVFFGNTKYSLIGATIINKSLPLSLIVTLPDRPDKKGRIVPSLLKTFALESNIPFLTVDNLDDKIIGQIASLEPDFLVVEDYGLILPVKLLALPKNASLNIHHSLLPKYRGASPAPAAILNGDTVSGVTVMKMAEEVDTGEIMGQIEYTLKPDETSDSLLTKLNTLGAELLIDIIKKYKNVIPREQDETNASFTERMKKSDGYFDIKSPPENLERMIRAYYPWPTAWSKLQVANGESKMIKFLPENKVQLEGGKIMSLKDFYNGHPELKEKIEKLF